MHTADGSTWQENPSREGEAKGEAEDPGGKKARTKKEKYPVSIEKVPHDILDKG